MLHLQHVCVYERVWHLPFAAVAGAVDELMKLVVKKLMQYSDKSCFEVKVAWAFDTFLENKNNFEKLLQQ